MKKNIILITFFVFFSFFGTEIFGQSNTPISPILTVDSLASGNYKDVLTSFFRLGLSGLTDTNKQINFSSNLFAYMLKHNPKLDIDTNYSKYGLARNTNIDIGLQLDDANQFGGFSFGIRHALINLRDYTVSKEFISLALSKNHDLYILHDSLVARRTLITDAALRKKIKEQTIKLFNDSAFTFSMLDPEIKQMVVAIAKDCKLQYFLNLINNNPDVCLNNYALERYNEVKESFGKKPLWVVGLNLKSYDDRFQAQTLSLSTEFLKGFFKTSTPSNLELDIKGSFDLSDDTSGLGRDLLRNTLTWDAGLNWVMKGWGDNQSFLEFKLSAGQSMVLMGLYEGEDENVFTMNGTLRFRISNNIWIPIGFRYDPKTRNLYGSINVTTNFTWLGAGN